SRKMVFFMNLFFTLMSLLIFLSGMGSCNSRSRQEDKMEHEVRIQTKSKLTKEMTLVSFGFGRPEQIKLFELLFQCRRSLNLQEGRKFLVNAIDQFLSEVNSDEKLRPYLDHYPFQPKDINLSILLLSPKETEEELSVITAREGILEYQKRES